jgi:hypothetical protein
VQHAPPAAIVLDNHLNLEYSTGIFCSIAMSTFVVMQVNTCIRVAQKYNYRKTNIYKRVISMYACRAGRPIPGAACRPRIFLCQQGSNFGYRYAFPPLA